MTKHVLQRAIESQVENGNRAFVPYMMAGDRGLDRLKEELLLFQKAGATAVELGIPFSDPVADGPTIQAAGKRALENGITLKHVLQEVRKIRADVQIPLVIMTYLNPVLQYGLREFAQDCHESGISGVIVPDLPLEESDFLHDELRVFSIALIQLVTLTSPVDRMERIAKASEGFLYAVTVTGITGAKETFHENLADHVAMLKKVSPVPVLTGFGISTPAQVRELSHYADGVIVGSKIIEALQENDEQTITELIDAVKGRVEMKG
ncbi:tryptophan synthase subunit alpha [Paenisporosarcina cavernae]|uniref:Tryptophan synthase alpha chain n=1 Tax=Paenisporosarcina cavernae TaxID=2320858 RepID=A0A385YPS1_9BACL|nr:tryptophan synthase subunit alpha [Paenisporosarcina cavernae]AYC28441.1 tryptophan synthase subunit alpha [Paenisporosarcina cavernae]